MDLELGRDPVHGPPDVLGRARVLADMEANLWWSGEWDQQPHYTNVRMDHQLLTSGMTTGGAQDLDSKHALLVSQVGSSTSELVAALNAAQADWAS